MGQTRARRPRSACARSASRWASIVVVAWALGSGVAAAQPMDEVFSHANDALLEGRTAEAIEGYRLLTEAGVRDPDVEHNLATAHAKRGEWGRAILHYERALMYGGEDDARQGLQAAQDALGRARAEAEGEATVDTGATFFSSVARSVGANTLAVSVLALDVALFALLGGLLFARREALRVPLGLAAIVAGVLLVLSGIGLRVHAGLRDEAIVLEDRVALREGPATRASPVAFAREGQRATITDRHREWVRLQLDGQAGWIPADRVARVGDDD